MNSNHETIKKTFKNIRKERKHLTKIEVEILLKITKLRNELIL